MMTLSVKRWSTFKQEFLAILYASCGQTVLNFAFPVAPAFIKVGAPWSIIMPGVLSFAWFVGYSYLFTFADTFAPYLSGDTITSYWKLEQIDHLPLGLMFLVSFHIGMLYMWYTNMYGVSNLHYAIYYVHYLIVFVLMARAVRRSKDICT